MNKQQKGFTLVEIAIVLVIVGLLLGAVLKGQELIFNSKVKATYNLSRELSASIYGYQDRYKQLPGDDQQAAARFPSANPLPINGNGNGLIAYGGTCAVGAQAGENCQALYAMRLAGFMTGAGLGPMVSPAGGFATLGTSSQSGGTSLSSVLTLFQNTATQKMMSAIDTSFDDGVPTTGTVRCAGVAAYDLANPDNRIAGFCTMAL